MQKFKPASTTDDIDEVHRALSARGRNARVNKEALKRVLADTRALSDRFGVKISDQLKSCETVARNRGKTVRLYKESLGPVAMAYGELHQRLTPQDVEA